MVRLGYGEGELAGVSIRYWISSVIHKVSNQCAHKWDRVQTYWGQIKSQLQLRGLEEGQRRT